MKEYTKEMRANHESCPYCKMWHSSMSCHPGVLHMVTRIKELEAENERLQKNNQTFADLAVKNPIDEAFDYTNDLETALKEIIQIQPLDVFGPMSDRMRRIAREALK